MKKFTNKTVVITGAGSGMGRAYALEFAKLGANLALNDFNQETLNQTIKLVRDQYDVKIIEAAFDVAQVAPFQAFAEQVDQQLGGADVVINNAGIEGVTGPAIQHSYDDVAGTMNVNFYGVVNGTQAFLPHLLAKKQGVLVNVASVFGLIGVPGASAYCASKYAVTGYTESIMAEFQDSKIQVHCVHPGGIATNIANAEDSQDFNNKYLTTPPQDIAKYLIKCIRRNQPRIVYGNQSMLIWLGSNFVPTKILQNILWQQLKKTVNLADYRPIIGR